MSLKFVLLLSLSAMPIGQEIPASGLFGSSQLLAQSKRSGKRSGVLKLFKKGTKLLDKNDMMTPFQYLQ